MDPVKTAMRIVLIGAGSFVGLVLVVVLGYVALVLIATHTAVARVDGDLRLAGLHAPVTIARDERGVPHIRAHDEHDLFFAQGYVEGSDRLFQMDLLRHYVAGRLAEWLGAFALASDREHRFYNITAVADTVYRRAGAHERMVVDAFADGVNAAAANEPLPPEYRALFIRFEPWRPQDAYVVGMATALELVDDGTLIPWRDQIVRTLGPHGADAFFPAGDPRYDAPVMPGAPLAIPPLPTLHDPLHEAQSEPRDDRAAVGSNDWAVGGAHVRGGRAVLANDPHLRLQIPGVWYLFEAAAPGLHIAGGSLAGTPGVILGHNAAIAWGVTNGNTAAMRVWYRSGAVRERPERIRVRFGRDVVDVEEDSDRGPVFGGYVLDWDELRNPRSPLLGFLELDHAGSIDAAMRALRDYPGPTQNFVFADTAGRVAYRMGGDVISDGDWGLRVLTPAGPPPPPHVVPFAQMPAISAARDAIVFTANNRPFAAGYPYRLAASFTAPLRAFEIERQLRAAEAAHPGSLTPETIGAIQNDLASPGEAELAADALAAARRHPGAPADMIAALSAFDGRLEPGSPGATAVVVLRRTALGMLVSQHLDPAAASAYYEDSIDFTVLLRALRERPRGWVKDDDYDAFLVAALVRARSAIGDTAIPPFGSYAGWTVQHPLAALGFALWNGPHFTGAGGSFAPAVQWNGHSQSFRALWIAGAWDEGGIDIPAGESGEPGSPHYRDLGTRWEAHVRTPLPFSDSAVSRATRATLTLHP
jgi:penicillin amidase